VNDFDGVLCELNSLDHNLGGWRHRHLPNILLLKFEDLLREPKGEIARVAEFCGVGNMADEKIKAIATATSFTVMKNTPKTNYTELKRFHNEITKALHAEELEELFYSCSK
jgi:hypothetical protein